ncbi:DNA-directed RNA polymerase III subunit RPC9 [Hirschfeldia incana]|nr:DNA-directed RNA polymerase III subunit RPC9 [Hirschfeldia incana]
MKNIIVKANAGALTNFEVLDFFNSRGASKDTTRAVISSSEYKVYDYLMETAASTQTRESVTKFSEKCKDFKLAKAEILNVINLRPSSDVELTPILEKPDEREIDIDGILALVQEFLPPLPSLEAPKENEQDETEDGEQEDTENGEQEETENSEQEETEDGEQS